MICPLCKERSQNFSCRRCIALLERERESKLMDLKDRIDQVQKTIQTKLRQVPQPPKILDEIKSCKVVIGEKQAWIKRNALVLESLRKYNLVSSTILDQINLKNEMDYNLSRSKIQDLIEMFRLRRVENNKMKQEVRILYFKFDLTNNNVNRRKLNQCVNVILKFVVLITKYLNQLLPNAIYLQERMIRYDFSELGLKPLELTERNGEDFLVGLATLNYNIAYLCCTQNVDILLEDCCDTLEMLAKLCGSPSLGKSVSRNLAFELIDVLEFHQQKALLLIG